MPDEELTPEHVLSLPAGRELDALVAERIMGWEDVRRERRPSGPRTGAPWFEEEEDCWDFWGTHVTVAPSKMRAMVERYSTDVAAAWKVMGAVRRDLFSYRNRFVLALQVAVTARLRLQSGLIAPGWVALEMEPEDVCRAALLAVLRKEADHA